MTYIRWPGHVGSHTRPDLLAQVQGFAEMIKRLYGPLAPWDADTLNRKILAVIDAIMDTDNAVRPPDDQGMIIGEPLPLCENQCGNDMTIMEMLEGDE